MKRSSNGRRITYTGDCTGANRDPEVWLRYYATEEEREDWAEMYDQPLPPAFAAAVSPRFAVRTVGTVGNPSRRKSRFVKFGCHCWLVQQCFFRGTLPALLDKPAVAPFLKPTVDLSYTSYIRGSRYLIVLAMLESSVYSSSGIWMR